MSIAIEKQMNKDGDMSRRSPRDPRGEGDGNI